MYLIIDRETGEGITSFMHQKRVDHEYHSQSAECKSSQSIRREGCQQKIKKQRILKSSA